MFVQMLFDTHLPDPLRHWEAFFNSLKSLVEKGGKQWCTVHQRPMPWINLKKLKSIYGDTEKAAPSRRPSWDHRPAAPAPRPTRAAPGMESIPERQFSASRNSSSQRPSFDRGGSSASLPSKQKSSGSRERRRATGAPQFENLQRQQRNSRPAFSKSQSCFNPKDSNAKAPQFSRSNSAPDNFDVDQSLSLEDILKQWSRKPPNYKNFYPLQHLLLTAQDTFPPMNPRVEPHAYFSKWKAVDKEVFSDLDGDELVNMLKKGVPSCLLSIPLLDELARPNPLYFKKCSIKLLIQLSGKQNFSCTLTNCQKMLLKIKPCFSRSSGRSYKKGKWQLSSEIL